MTTTPEFHNVTGDNLADQPTAVIITMKLWAYAGIAILVMGTIGNLLSITVLSTSKTLRKFSSTVYLLAMDTAGLVSFYTGLLRCIILLGLSQGQDDIRSSHDIVCKLHAMMTYASLQYFAWMQATVAVDRLISILYPHFYRTSCNWKLGAVILLMELVAVLSLNSLVLTSISINKSGNCFFIQDIFNVWTYVDFLSFSVIPAVIICVCNLAILHLLKKNKMSSKRHKDITVMLMSLNVFFIITTLPISIIYLIDWGEEVPHFLIMKMYWTVFSLFQYIGGAGTFFVYCLSSPTFRKELRRLLCMRSASDKYKNHPVLADHAMPIKPCYLPPT